MNERKNDSGTDSLARCGRKETPKLHLLLFICFAIGIVTLASHSFVAGFFIAGPLAAGLCFYARFRKIALWFCLALIVIIVAISVFAYIEGQQKIAVRHQAPYFGFRVANAEEVQRYDNYIANGGDPNQLPVYDRLAIALYRNPKFLLENKSVLDELQQKRP